MNNWSEDNIDSPDQLVDDMLILYVNITKSVALLGREVILYQSSELLKKIKIQKEDFFFFDKEKVGGQMFALDLAAYLSSLSTR